MRSSLMNFSLSADMLRTRAEDKEDAELLCALRSITHSYYRMMRVLTNASAVLSITQGSLIFSPEELDVARLVSGLVETAAMLSPQVELKLVCEQVQPIVADRQLVELIILNLISNCLVHAVGCTRIALSLMGTRDSLIISVDDDGCGIAPEQLGSVFDRYCHGFDMGSMLSGAGLGLTVVRSAACLHGRHAAAGEPPGEGHYGAGLPEPHISSSVLKSPGKTWSPA